MSPGSPCCFTPAGVALSICSKLCRWELESSPLLVEWWCSVAPIDQSTRSSNWLLQNWQWGVVEWSAVRPDSIPLWNKNSWQTGFACPPLLIILSAVNSLYWRSQRKNLHLISHLCLPNAQPFVVGVCRFHLTVEMGLLFGWEESQENSILLVVFWSLASPGEGAVGNMSRFGGTGSICCKLVIGSEEGQSNPVGFCGELDRFLT